MVHSIQYRKLKGTEQARVTTKSIMNYINGKIHSFWGQTFFFNSAPGGLPTGTTTPAATTVGICGKDRWQCADQSCIDSDQYCDYQEDCPDKSDEAFCGKKLFLKALRAISVRDMV